MILQSLDRLYHRLLAEDALEPPGFQKKEILWLVSLTPDGSVSGLQRSGGPDPKERGRRFTVPAEIKKTAGIAANLLWENAEYALGVAKAKADDKQAATPMRQTLDSIRRGLVDCSEDQNTGFFVLAVAPNAARLAVRSWIAATVGEVAKRFEAHFEALDIIGSAENRPIPTLWRLLGELMPKADIKLLKDALRGRLSGDIMAAVLNGTPYPATLLARAVERCRLENSVRPLRAALIKAVLSRRSSPEERPPTMSLDLDCKKPGYLLGRLFAVLESIQHAAQGKLNVTIRDRYFGAAMTSPRAVYAQLERLKNAHLKKLRRDKGGLGVFFEKEFDSITEKMEAEDGFPPALSLDDQGRFILGYHHQRTHYLTKHDATPAELVAILAAETDSDE